MILENFSSPYIHQAILILKDYNPALEGKIIEEAESIVGEYLNGRNRTVTMNKKSKFPLLILSVLALISVIVTCFLLL